eukprot:GHVU01073018.1.p1 GENE.GHVU01073018.1~~GHVU01073018.1.p1  ORF type:complete len:162 (-),score=3.08 GHVU01073018.1:863-1348(-)
MAIEIYRNPKRRISFESPREMCDELWGPISGWVCVCSCARRPDECLRRQKASFMHPIWRLICLCVGNALPRRSWSGAGTTSGFGLPRASNVSYDPLSGPRSPVCASHQRLEENELAGSNANEDARNESQGRYSLFVQLCCLGSIGLRANEQRLRPQEILEQ